MQSVALSRCEEFAHESRNHAAGVIQGLPFGVLERFDSDRHQPRRNILGNTHGNRRAGQNPDEDPGNPVGNPIPAAFGERLGQVPGQYPRGSIPTPQISPPRRLPISNAGWIWCPTGSRSSPLWCGGHLPCERLRDSCILTASPFCHPDLSRPHKDSRRLASPRWSIGVAGLPQKLAHHKPRPFRMSTPISVVRLFGIVQERPAGGTEVRTERRRRGCTGWRPLRPLRG